MASHLSFAELRCIAEYSADSAAILDAIDALERAEPIAQAAREFVDFGLSPHWGQGEHTKKLKALIAAVDAERADREGKS